MARSTPAPRSTNARKRLVSSSRFITGIVISPSSLTIYSGRLIPEWKGNFLLGGLSSRALVRLVLNDDRVVGEERLLTDLGARIRAVVEGPDGGVYLLTDSDGKLLEITPKRAK